MKRPAGYTWAAISQCSMDYYALLGIVRESTTDDIKARFRELSKKYHPDHLGQDTLLYRRYLEAYKILSDPDERARYDVKLMLEKNVARENELSSHLILPSERLEYPESLLSCMEDGQGEVYNEKMGTELPGVHDLTVKVRPVELRLGVSIRVPVAVRDLCTVCGGKKPACGVCQGTGWVRIYEYRLFQLPRTAVDTEVLLFIPGPSPVSHRRLEFSDGEGIRIRVRYIS